jgi:hypothetical protein
MTPALRAMTQLTTWRDLLEAAPSCGTGRALRSTEQEIAHFHTDWDVDLHLTGRTVHRLEHDLRRSEVVRVVPGSAWVTLRLEADSDVDVLITLVSLALQAHQKTEPPLDGHPPACNHNRRVAIRHEFSI